MDVLVLGGTHFVGRSLVDTALARGHRVTVLNRGVSAPAPDGAEALLADRTDADAVRGAVGDRKWDAVIDTWSGAPKALGPGYALLAERTAHLGYVSSWSVYRQPVPVGGDESAPTIPGDPDDEADGFYPTAKRGGELAALRAFGERALISRAGPVLGPGEDVGSLTWWLRRVHRGGRVLAPGTPEDPLQYVDVRDHSAWLLGAAERGAGGVFTVACARGSHTMGEFLAEIRAVTASDAEFVWVPDEALLAAGVRPYLDLPLWLPAPMRGGVHDLDVSAAHRAGLDTSRPLPDTLAATWAWLEREGEPPWRRTHPARGLDPDTERRVLDQVV